MRHLPSLAGALALATAALSAQAPVTAGPVFDVASVKRNTSGTNMVMMGGPLGSGRFTATNLPLRSLIQNAYDIQPFQLVGGPADLLDARFDINARLDPATSRDDQQLMLRALLADRFKLAVHTDTREMPVYALVTAKPDGSGVTLAPSAVDCAARAAAGPRGGGPAAPPPPPRLDEPMVCGTMMAPGTLNVGGGTMPQLARLLGGQLGRIVLDQTGLTGSYDFTLSYTPDQIPQFSGPPPPGAPPLPAIDANGPSLLTALQEQLGLKLESQRGPVDVVVIDHVESPTED